MIVWPYLPVWPFLLLGAGLCGVWNLRAGIAFAVAVLLVRASIYLGLSDPLIFRMVMYSVMAFVVLFFVDRIAGGFFALVSATLSFAILGHIDMRAHVIASEAVLLFGMLASAISGPTGGLLSPLYTDRPDPARDMVPQHRSADNQTHHFKM
ncbi:hypothetical protein [Sulfitobacter sp.]|uniref:hypothetical protein n=1 Tax=Sulfitobacter sp. TaxID=1903071 RepID=UPI003F6A5CC6